LYTEDDYSQIRNHLTLLLLKRVIGTKVRDIGKLEWEYPSYQNDVRFEPIESFCPATDTRKSK